MTIAPDEMTNGTESTTTARPGPRRRFLGLRGPTTAQGQPAPRFAVIILLVILAIYTVQISVNLASARPKDPISLVGMGCMLVIDAMQLIHSLPGAEPLRRKYGRWTLLIQALVTYLPIFLYGTVWGSVGGFLAGSAALLLPSALGWMSFGLIVGSISIIGAFYVHAFYLWLYITLSTTVAALIIYSLTRLVSLVIEMHRARGQLARLAVSQERLRFARDLHDLLGYSLSAITLKSEVAIRLVPNHQGRAVNELTSILEISRQALADVREVANSYRDMSLSREVEAAEAMLATAEIEVESQVICPPLANGIDTVLATVLREGVTNMLRHSKVQHCRIEVAQDDRTVRLRIVNDGVPANAAADRAGPPRLAQRSGSGLGNLAGRVSAIGGRLTAGVRADGRFQVLAEVPLEMPEAAGPAEELPEAA